MSQFTTLLKKELWLVARARESLTSMLFFSFLMILIIHLGFPLVGQNPIPYVCPFVWLSVLFGGMLRMNRTFEPEIEGNLMEQFKLAKGIAVPFYLSKFIVNFIFVVLLEVFVFVLVVLLFNVPDPLGYLSKTWPVYLLGALGFTCLGTLFSAMLLSHLRRDLILPVISYPILIPLIVAVIHSFEYSSTGDLIGIQGAWIRVVIAFDVIYMVSSVLVFEKVMEA